MQKLKALLTGIAAVTILSSAMSTQAQTYGDGDNPFEEGGCSAAVYNEETYSPYQIYSWAVPDLANGQSVDVDAGLTRFDPFTGQAIVSGPGGQNMWLTFTCNNGVISGGANYGYWTPA
jgi:hypothetical protein